MVLNAAEQDLINVVRTIHPDEARNVLEWAQHLVELGHNGPVEWSDAWTDDDLREVTVASIKRFDQREHEES
jgi:hypothetical protein